MGRRCVASIAIACAVVAFAVAGCGSSGGTDSTGAEDGDGASSMDSVDGAASTEAPSADSSEPQTAPSPLEEALGFPSDPERRQYLLITMQRQADFALVACMQRAGFHYAVPPAEDLFRSGAFVGDGSRAWTEINGLGITSSFAAALVADADADASGTVDAATTNLEYVATLTEQQALDYDRALIGDAAATAAGDGSAYEPGGCFADAFSDMLRTVALVDEFAPSLASLNSRFNSDPRVLGLQSRWSDCMSDAGFDYPDENALIDDVYARLLEVDLVDTGGVTEVASSAALDELLGYERSAAIASYDCRQNVLAELTALRADYEQEFLDDNRFRIAELAEPAEPAESAEPASPGP